jgi:hypothetical protein
MQKRSGRMSRYKVSAGSHDVAHGIQRARHDRIPRGRVIGVT